MTAGKPPLYNEHRKSTPHTAKEHFPIRRQLGYNINQAIKAAVLAQYGIKSPEYKSIKGIRS